MTAVSINVDDRVILISTLVAVSGYLLLQWHKTLFERRQTEDAAAAADTQDSRHDDPTNTEAAWASRLLELHFTRSLHDDPFESVQLVQAMADANAAFAPALALMAERHCEAMTDFTGERAEAVALVLGCGAGGTAVALAEAFPRVLAMDASQRCIDAAKALQEQGCLSYRGLTAEGPTGPRRLAQVSPGVDTARITFMRADPETFAAEMDMASADAIVLPGLLTRLPRPAAFLDALAPPLRPGGVVAIATDYGWDPSVTRHAERLLPTGGEQQSGDGREAQLRELGTVMEAAGFVLVAEAEHPTAARRDGRRYTVGVQHCTVWKQR